MSKIENLIYKDERTGLFYDGPGEFLVLRMVEMLKKESPWCAFFGEAIDPYRRMDYPFSSLPALRVYSPRLVKEYDSWFIDGDVRLDIILPSDIRRRETQQVQDTVAAALLQEFRKPAQFEALRAQVPGLNELGKRFEVNKDLGFEWSDKIVPLTQVTMNFRIDLREWDEYLEETNRTKDSPFEEVLADLRRVVTQIAAEDDSGSTQVVVGLDQPTT